MPKLIIKQENQTHKTLDLAYGSVTIGRSEDNDVHIPDHTVSSHHAKIFTYLNASYIEDLHSSNGTFINGKRIEKHTLKPGDVVTVGHHVLEVEN